jgi:hypothetical protein
MWCPVSQGAASQGVREWCPASFLSHSPHPPTHPPTGPPTHRNPDCCISWLDSSRLEELPKGVQALLPAVLTNKSGLGIAYAEQLKTQPSHGVPLSNICDTFNEGMHTSHALRKRGYLMSLWEDVDSGTIKAGQVGGSSNRHCRTGKLQCWGHR